MLIAEELMLLATLPGKGRPSLSAAQFVEPAVAGALVAELALLGRVDVVGRRLVVLDATPTGDDLLDDTLGLLGRERIADARDVKRQLKRVDAGLKRLNARVTDRLVRSGVLTEERRRALGVLPVTRHPVADHQRRLDLAAGIRLALGSGNGAMDARTGCLVALLGGAKLLRHVVHGRAAEKRARPMVRSALASCPVGRAVEAIVKEIETANVLAAAVAVSSG